MQRAISILTKFRRTFVAGCAVLILLAGVVLGDYLNDKMAWRHLREWYEMRVSKSRTFDARTAHWEDRRTSLQRLEYLRVPLRWVLPDGGGIDEIDGSIVFATSLGEIGYFTATGSLVYLRDRIPMNLEGVDAHPISRDPRFNRDFIRVTDILAVQKSGRLSDLYVGHNYFKGDCIEWRVSRVTVSTDKGVLSIPDPAWDTVFVATPCVAYVKTGIDAFAGYQSGGRIVSMGPDTLLMSIGDYHFDGDDRQPKVSMNPGLSLGKILKLTISTRKVETFAIGLRNPQGLLVDSKGRVWETEHGPQGGDELNLIEQGHNYGWPEVTLGVAYTYDNWPFNPVKGRHDLYTMPRYAWTPSVGVSNLIEANGTEFPFWRGDLLVATLTQHALHYLRLDGDRVVYAEPIHLPGDRLRDVFALKDGRIAVLTDRPDILIIRNRELKTGGDAIVLPASAVAPIGARPEGLGGADLFKASCATCHSITAVNQIGPHLAGVAGRRVGSIQGFAYSPSLNGSDRTWSKDLLKSFVQDPQSAFPGTTMAGVGLSPQELDVLVDYLETVRP